jgi:hypothetical protein
MLPASHRHSRQLPSPSARQMRTPDRTHPSNKGNEVIASVLEDLGSAPLVP